MYCRDNTDRMGADFAEAVNKIPVLRFQKEPVFRIEDLYVRYPQGGEYGWYAFVSSEGTFAYWDIENRTWRLLSKVDLQTMLGKDTKSLKDGDVPVWDKEQEKFVIMNMNVLGTEDY